MNGMVPSLVPTTGVEVKCPQGQSTCLKMTAVCEVTRRTAKIDGYRPVISDSSLACCRLKEGGAEFFRKTNPGYDMFR